MEWYGFFRNDLINRLYYRFTTFSYQTFPLKRAAASGFPWEHWMPVTGPSQAIE